MENTFYLLIHFHFFYLLWSIFSCINLKSIISNCNRSVISHKENLADQHIFISICRHFVICLLFAGSIKIIISDPALHLCSFGIKIRNCQNLSIIRQIQCDRISCISNRNLLLYQNISCRIIGYDLR